MIVHPDILGNIEDFNASEVFVTRACINEKIVFDKGD